MDSERFLWQFRDVVPNEILETKGGEGSGNFGHAGRPGEVGGSAPDGAGGTTAPPKGTSLPGEIVEGIRKGKLKDAYDVVETIDKYRESFGLKDDDPKLQEVWRWYKENKKVLGHSEAKHGDHDQSSHGNRESGSGPFSDKMKKMDLRAWNQAQMKILGTIGISDPDDVMEFGMMFAKAADERGALPTVEEFMEHWKKVEHKATEEFA
jgi:hypothetical protein